MIRAGQITFELHLHNIVIAIVWIWKHNCDAIYNNAAILFVAKRRDLFFYYSELRHFKAFLAFFKKQNNALRLV